MLMVVPRRPQAVRRGRVVEGLLPSDALAKAGLPQLRARQVLDAAMFLAKERTYPYLLPRHSVRGSSWKKACGG